MSRLWAAAASDRGSEAIEAAVGVPAFLLLIGLVIFGGRVAVTHQAVSAAADQAARAASIARTVDQAHADSVAAAVASLDRQGLQCVSRSVTVDLGAFTAPPGTPAQVASTVTCQVDLADLAVPGVPGSHTVTATMSSPIDTYRER